MELAHKVEVFDSIACLFCAKTETQFKVIIRGNGGI